MLLSPPPQGGRVRVGGIFDGVARRKIQTWPRRRRDACAHVRPRRKRAYGPFSAANRSRDIGSAARRPLGRTSSISFVCAAAWSSRLTGDSMPPGCKRTPRAPHGSRAKVFGSCDFGTTTCSATRTAWSRRFGKLSASQIIPAKQPTTESMMADRLPDRTPDRHPLPNLPHQGGGVRKRTVDGSFLRRDRNRSVVRDFITSWRRPTAASFPRGIRRAPPPPAGRDRHRTCRTPPASGGPTTVRR